MSRHPGITRRRCRNAARYRGPANLSKGSLRHGLPMGAHAVHTAISAKITLRGLPTDGFSADRRCSVGSDIFRIHRHVRPGQHGVEPPNPRLRRRPCFIQCRGPAARASRCFNGPDLQVFSSGYSGPEPPGIPGRFTRPVDSICTSADEQRRNIDSSLLDSGVIDWITAHLAPMPILAYYSSIGIFDR